MKNAKISIFVTIFFLLLALFHNLNPKIVPDSITLGCLLLAMLPWIAPKVTSFEAFGIKIGFEQIKQAEDILTDRLSEPKVGTSSEQRYSTTPEQMEFTKVAEPRMGLKDPDLNIDNSASQQKRERSNQTSALPAISDVHLDPNLSLIEIGIELEKHLRSFASRSGIDTNKSIKGIIYELKNKNIIQDNVAVVFMNILEWRNSVAHGVSLEPGLAERINQLRKLTIEYLSRMN